MNSLQDVKRNMGELYDSLKNGNCELKMAAELANIAGKYLKAEQLELAEKVFLANKRGAMRLAIGNEGPEVVTPVAKRRKAA